MVTCPKCGQQLADGNRICIYCGAALTDDESAAAQQQPTAAPTPAAPPQPPAYQQQPPAYQPPPAPPAYGQQPPMYQQPMTPPPTYQQPMYPQQPPVYPQPPYYMPGQKAPGESAATGAMVCGIIGLFFFGFIFGIIALVQGNKAKRLGFIGGKATAGIVLGIIDIIGWVLLMILEFA